MATYEVTYEQKFFATIEVEADSEEEAVAKIEDNVAEHFWVWDASEQIDMIEVEEVDS